MSLKYEFAAKMSTFSPVVCKGVLELKTRIVVLNVHDSLRHQMPLSSGRNIVSSCAAMTGISQSTIYKLLSGRKNGDSVKPPKKAGGKKPLEVDEAARSLIRRKVHSFYFKNEIPTLDKILAAIREEEDIPEMGRKKLWKVLHELNFSWQKQGRKSLLIDKEEIICWRRKYLRSIKKYRQEQRNIFYLDETWINEGHSVSKYWQDNNVGSSHQAFIDGLHPGLKIPSGKGRRLIITHIGSDKGFVSGGLLQFQSKSTNDYHEEMTADVFEDYFSELITSIPVNSVIVMDNASYHSRLAEKLPISSWRKGDIINWLKEKQIPFENDALKTELLQIARENKTKFKRHVIDEMAVERGIIVLRLPPHHCELNPIELIWAQVKGYVGRHNTTFKLKDVQELLKIALDNVTEENWSNAVNHVKKEEDKMWKLDNLLEQSVEPLVIQLTMSDSEDSIEDFFD